MSRLAISLGQHSDRGRKETNQDFHGALIPDEPLLSLKGIAVVLADGISTSDVSAIASESAVKSFLTDYYCTPESWSVKTSAQRVIAATNSWLHSQTRQSQYLYDKDRGYVCTLSAMVIKSTTAHIFHIGDARVYRVVGHGLQQLTEDHRIVISSAQSYLGRALGINQQVEIDYQAIKIERGDIFLLATDGVYEHVSGRFIAETINDSAGAWDAAAAAIVEEAKRQGKSLKSTACRTAMATKSSGRCWNCRARRCWKREWCWTAFKSSGKFTAAAEAIFIWQSIPRMARW
jgi:serine/threonine protein phosphatase PrpC